jgi:hypothetical protein
MIHYFGGGMPKFVMPSGGRLDAGVESLRGVVDDGRVGQVI